MRRSMWPRRIAGVLAVLLFVTLAVSCRTDVYVEPHVQETAYPYPTAQVVSPTSLPDPTEIPPTATPAPVAFRMTILHTSEVAGQVLPCG